MPNLKTSPNRTGVCRRYSGPSLKNLSKDRELVTIAALANMTGTGGQLWFHLGAALNSGLTEEQLKDFVAVLKTKVGEEQSDSAATILADVLGAEAN